LAARRLARTTLDPDDVNGVEETRCCQVLRKLGFAVVPKADGAADQGRSPPWARDELILALELYFRHPPKTVSETHPEVVRLSETLNALPIHADRPEGEQLRNPDGVYMKLSDFQHCDPSYEDAGLSGGGNLEQRIWDEFAADEQGLHHLAEAIAIGATVAGADLEPADEDETDFPEGKVLYRLHRQHECDLQLVNEVKRRAMEEKALRCAVCDFDFLKEYGETYIECHHTVPVSEYRPGQKTQINDLVLVCANCHRMLHRRRPWRTTDQLASLRIGSENRR
jgi:5-methylcytosine-specific restriction protein A